MVGFASIKPNWLLVMENQDKLSSWRYLGRNRGGLSWKEAEVSLRGLDLGNPAWAGCWREWGLAAGVRVGKGLLKGGRMEVGSSGKGFLGGWALLAEKLRSIGILSRDETREAEIPHKTESKDGAPKGKKEKSYVEVVNTREAPRERRLGEAVWIQLGEEDVGKGREFLDRCLVGCWGETEITDADLP
ncbi:hypothetical protein CK203_018663 [Vitis vinifera]|uniref:DUF4283 domain-containing protein n=1 Tax=Vitis vinifera TaxID=29760 RepID=A0A438JAJ1_VITVI|nr:hypothetical protein CK203_018663 [Vitis vinifera]